MPIINELGFDRRRLIRELRKDLDWIESVLGHKDISDKARAGYERDRAWYLGQIAMLERDMAAPELTPLPPRGGAA
jgi:hypothetical protein